MEEKKNGKVLNIVLIVMAIVIAVLAGVLSYIFFGGKDKDKTEESSETSSVVTTVSETETETETETSIETTTKHVSPVETVSFSMGREKSDINEVMDYDDNKTYKANLSELAGANDKIDSFVFVFYANDGSSNIRSYKGACGISVSDDCSAATDDGWYQSDDFEMSVNSAYLEVKWDVPGDIKDYIDTENGTVQIGYWWGGVQKLRLASIICNYTTTAEIPVDGTKTIDVGTTLNYEKEKTKEARIPLSDILGEGDTLQYVSFDIEAGGELQKYSGAFGVSVDSSCDAATDKNWYQSPNCALMTSSNTGTLHWLVPDSVKEYISSSGDLMLGYWWSKQTEVTLKSITVKYSNDGTGRSAPVNEDDKTVKPNDSEPSADGGESAKEIVNNIKIGWNLGNTLDCYDVKGDAETAWGNPKTTKAMIDKVKESGFNALRVPVSWNDHMNGDTIDEKWMNRVQEVVDYGIDNGMYVILNVHHDDYTWINPTKADEAKVKARLVKVWEQISAKFKDYDSHLIFEGMNEPRIVGSANEWIGGTDEEHQVINNLFQAFVDTVRASGGNNKTRALIVTSHAASITDKAVNGVRVPDDDNIIVSIHAYNPWEFAGNESNVSTFGSDADKKSLDDGFDMLKSKFIDKGIPVIIGEFGSVNKNNTSDRVNHMEYYVKSAKQRGIKCFIWDNGVKKEFGLLDRKNLSWYFPEIIDAAMKSAK